MQCDIELEPLRTEIVLGLTIGIMTMAKAMTGIEDLAGDVDLDFQNQQVLINIRTNSAVLFDLINLI